MEGRHRLKITMHGEGGSSSLKPVTSSAPFPWAPAVQSLEADNHHNQRCDTVSAPLVIDLLVTATNDYIPKAS